MTADNTYSDFMLDIETTGTDPVATAILQIAIVPFNVDTGEVCPQFFNRSLRIPPRRYWDEETRTWWGKKKDVYAAIVARSEDPALVMRECVRYVEDRTDQSTGARLWGKPISFDGAFFESYCKQFGVDNPFPYSNVVDMRTFIRAKLGTWDIRAWERERPLVGVAHNALYDALHQVKLVLDAAYLAAMQPQADEFSRLT